MPVAPLELMARGKLRPSFVILPNLMIPWLPRLAAQSAFFEDVAFRVAVQFEEPGFLGAIPAIGQNDEYLSFHNVTDSKRI